LAGVKVPFNSREIRLGLLEALSLFRSIRTGIVRFRSKVKKAHDQLQFSVFDYGEIHAAKNGYSVGGRKREPPSQVIAKPSIFVVRRTIELANFLCTPTIKA
jgi:hypothetical protein